MAIIYIYHQIKFRKGMMKRSPIKKLFLQISQYPQKNTFVGVLKLYYKEGPIHVFSCEYCEIFKNTCFQEHL